MGMFVNSGNEAWKVALNSEIYVDKTGLLDYTNKVMDTLQGYICNSRPRRFGKSITANMLTAYYSRGCDSKKLFENLQISKSEDFEKHLNKYDVIHFDVQWCMEPAGGAENVVSYIVEKVLKELKDIYSEELPKQIQSLPEALACINDKTGRKFIIIIDEWDVLIRDESGNERIQEAYINFLRGMFKGTEPTKYIKLAYLTGILPIKKLKTQSALNNFSQFSMINAGAISPYVGFTEDEVKKLCEKYNQDFGKAKIWYDGYQLAGYHLYNPNAIVGLMLSGEYQSYWSVTGSYETIVPLINMDFDGLRADIIELLSGNSVEVDVISFQNDTVNFLDKNDVLTYLIHLGYLAYDAKMKEAFIPNEEIREEFTRATKRRKWTEMIEFWQKSQNLLDATLDMDSDMVAEYIEEIHMDYASAIHYNSENSLSGILSIGYLSAMQYYFKPVRELHSERGFADFVFLPKPEYIEDYPALIVELKWNKDAKTAIMQIKDNKYPNSISRYTGKILLVGINYDKKTKKHQCIIEKIQKADI